MRVLLVSILVLIPCFWHTHIQAGDLGSHMYNVWLAQLIREGNAQGLYLEWIYTNVLFDLWAGWLVQLTGFGWGERLAVATVVLTFFWGSWVWVRSTPNANPWPITPLLAMLTYGWVFQAGFLNFYWSLGFCFWGLALAESQAKWKRRLWWVALIPAAVAHMLPVGWAVALYLYGQSMQRVNLRRRARLLAAGLAGIAAISVFIQMRYSTIWSPEQVLVMLGVDQVLLSSSSYLVIAAGFLAIWGLGLLWVLDAQPPSLLAQRRLVHFLALTAVGVLLIPLDVHLPGFSSPLSLIAQRMSLPTAVLICGLLSLGNRAKPVFYFGMALALGFFWMMYRDTAALDHFEDKLHAAVRTLPAGLRVVAPYEGEPARAFSYDHIVDRACIGHCFSYANYEAATTQFRVRARGANPIVAHDAATSLALQFAQHVVTGPEAPLYYFRWIPVEQRFELRILRAGDGF